MAILHQDSGQPANGQKVLLATTSYDNPDDSYTFAIQASRMALHDAGIPTAYMLLRGNCHVDDARNRIIQEFLLTDCTDLVFLDADLSWKPWQLVRLCQHDQDVVGGCCPYRREDKYGGMPVRLIPGETEENGLLKVEGIGTAFLRMKRHVIERLVADCEFFDGHNGLPTKTPLLFQRTLINGTRWGGDFNFCNLWRAAGGDIFCDHEIVLGHASKIVIYDSLAAATRRLNGETLKHIAEKIRNGKDELSDYTEALQYMGNPFCASVEVLAVAVGLARKATMPIIESGSGLTTILMAAATKQTVYCLEHNPLYAEKLRQMASEARVPNIGLCSCAIDGEWYDLTGKTLPYRFSLGLNDGPPRTIGSRRPFMDVFGGKCESIICDDADDPPYRSYLEDWATTNAHETQFIEPRAMLLKAT